jgi:hypothetical protein
MKRKSTSRRGVAFLKAHALLFALFIVGMTLNILVTIYHPTNAKLSLEVFRMMITQSLVISLGWAALFLTHLGIHQIRSLRERRRQRLHFDEVEAIQERYEASTRLDVDAQDENEILEPDIWQQALLDNQRRKSK